MKEPTWLPRCEVCGRDWGITMTFTKGGEQVTILCDLCGDPIDAGMLRPEVVDGERRYRQYHIQPMTRGKLLPRRG